MYICIWGRLSFPNSQKDALGASISSLGIYYYRSVRNNKSLTLRVLKKEDVASKDVKQVDATQHCGWWGKNKKGWNRKGSFCRFLAQKPGYREEPFTEIRVDPEVSEDVWVELFMCYVWSLGHVQLFATLRTAAHQASLSFTISWRFSNSHPLSQWCHPTISSSVILFSCPQSSQYFLSLFHWVCPLHQVVKVLVLQLQHRSSQFRAGFWLVWPPCCLSGSQL